MNRPYEFQLSEPVSEWLRSRGCRVYAEVIYSGCTIDLVGIHGEMPGHIVNAVELKRHFSDTAFGQVSYHQYKVHFSWIAAFSKPRQSTIEYAQQQRIGLLTVKDDQVTVVLEAQRNHVRSHPLMIRRAHQGGLAGKASSIGPGPAQQVYEAVAKYRTENPQAKWNEIYLSVPNHYATANSLAGGMRSVDERARWKQMKGKP